MRLVWFLAAVLLTCYIFYPTQSVAFAADDDETGLDDDAPVLDRKLKVDTTTATDAEVVRREQEAIKLDGLSVAESKALRERAEKHEFQAEVNRMMTLIINSLYKNKEIFLRELISNASDALDKIRFLSLTDASTLGDKKDLNIKIHVDKENKVLHITDSGIGMTKEDLIKNLGTIAKSGTSEFLSKMKDAPAADTSNLIGQFGVGFYSAFLVADTVVVTSKNNADKQHIWTSDANSFTVVEDPRPEEQLVRGTRVSLYLKEEAQDFLDTETIKNLIKKYSEFINFDIYLYTSKTVEVEREEEDDEEAAATEGDEAKAEAEEGEKKPKTVTETQWDWEIINANKPIWTRNPKDITEDDYNKFYKAFSREDKDPIGYTHFTAEGEVTFKAILYIPSSAPRGFFQEYGKHHNNIKMYVRRVFITDEFEDLLPKYLSFLTGVVDSDDLPLNVSRETLQQHKLLKVIKKKLVRKALEMLKKLEPEAYDKFYKEFSTSLKLGLIEDHANRTRLAKLLRFASSNDSEKSTSLDDYVKRMKKDQSSIFFMAGQSRPEVANSPFVERLLKRGFEVLYLTEAVDEYTIQNLPEYEGHKFQNVAKEGLKFGDETEEENQHLEKLKTDFEPLTKWLGDKLSGEIEKATISTRLTESPCALVASQYAWDGNMERIMKAQTYAQQDDGNSFYATQKKTLEINPYHPLVKQLLVRVQDEETAGEDSTLNMAQVLVDTARLRSGYLLQDSQRFASRIESMLRLSMGVDANAKVESEPVFERKADEKKDDVEDLEEEEEEEHKKDEL